MAARSTGGQGAQARSPIAETGTETARRQLGRFAAILDVRDPAEFGDGHLPGAVNLPQAALAEEMARHPALNDPTAPILVYSGAGDRGALACRALLRAGFSGAIHLAGGWRAWCAARLPTQKAPAAT